MNRVHTAAGKWITLSEKGQILLRSACADRNAFLVHRDRLVYLVVRMGEDLDQADVFILAYDSDSCSSKWRSALTEYREGGRCRRPGRT